jgi:peroxiredoxin
MLESGDTAPTFTATRGTSDHESFDLGDALGDGPVVLAFFPGAFTEIQGESPRVYSWNEADTTCHKPHDVASL